MILGAILFVGELCEAWRSGEKFFVLAIVVMFVAGLVIPSNLHAARIAIMIFTEFFALATVGYIYVTQVQRRKSQ